MHVLFGRTPIGSVSPMTVTTRLPEGTPRLLVLAGRTWLVSSIDWRRRIIQVTEHAGAGRSLWSGGSPDISFELANATRNVLLGEDPPVELSRRGSAALDRVRTQRAGEVSRGGRVLQRSGDEQIWWTFAGTKANASLVGALEQSGYEASASSEAVRMHVGHVDVLRNLSSELLRPPTGASVDPRALEGLKFSVALPLALASATLSERGTDPQRALQVSAEPLLVHGASGDLGGE